MNRINILIVVIILTSSVLAGADGPKPNVLDFDAEVIEGERKTPSVFLEIGTENPNMESVIFQRPDFNDFHVLDSKRRQQFQPLYSK